MATRSAPRGRETFASRAEFERWHTRRRWARAGLVYLAMLFFAVVLIGPILFAAVSSVKTNPLEYPPTLAIPQLSPANWSAAARLGAAGRGGRWFGGFAPGADVPFRITYFVPEGQQAQAPEVVVSRRRSGGLQAAQVIEFAADYAKVSPVQRVSSTPGSYAVRDEETAGQFVTYSFNVTYPGQGPKIDTLPVDITAPVGQLYQGATLSPSRLERRGRVASFDTIVPGALGYVFRNYVRVYAEVKSVTTGESLFWAWTRNSFVIGIVRVISTLLFASMAGYALARLRFPGKNIIFFATLFSMMIPGQVTFISNYLVLRDGIFGLTRHWPHVLIALVIFGVLLIPFRWVYGGISKKVRAREGSSRRIAILFLLLRLLVYLVYLAAAIAAGIYIGFTVGASLNLERFGAQTLLNTIWAVIVGGASGSALVAAGMVFLMKQFFESIPNEVEEAAMIDGANHWQRYWRVVLPMARPALGAVAILTFQGAWNEFFWPLIALTTPEDVKTLPIGLLSFRQIYGATGDWGLILAGAILSALPIVILFVVFQRYFLEGVSYGGGKE